jgi:hypothetical protein
MTYVNFISLIAAVCKQKYRRHYCWSNPHIKLKVQCSIKQGKGKSKFVPVHVMKSYRTIQIQRHSFLTLLLVGAELHTLVALPPPTPLGKRKHPPYQVNRRLSGVPKPAWMLLSLLPSHYTDIQSWLLKQTKTECN